MNDNDVIRELRSEIEQKMKFRSSSRSPCSNDDEEDELPPPSKIMKLAVRDLNHTHTHTHTHT